MDVYDRARAYVARMDSAISGGGGHDATFRVACALVGGFSLSPSDALQIMREYNSRCDPPWSDAELEHKVRSAGENVTDPGYLLRGTTLQKAASRGPVHRAATAAAPRSPQKKRPEFDVESLRKYVLGMPKITEAHFVDRSEVPIPAKQSWNASRLFFETVYEPGERLLIFANEMSQGQWLYQVGRGLFKLGKEPGEQARPATEPPEAGPCGIWYLCAPVDGQWRKGGKTMSRRSGNSVQSFRWFLLESDDADAADWLKFLFRVPLPIAAIYTSGGRSYHALINIGAETKAQWDTMRDELFYKLLCPVGADGGAMSAVRLTRLPGGIRKAKRNKEGKLDWFPAPRLQKLIYLHPRPTWQSVQQKGFSNG